MSEDQFIQTGQQDDEFLRSIPRLSISQYIWDRVTNHDQESIAEVNKQQLHSKKLAIVELDPLKMKLINFSNDFYLTNREKSRRTIQ